MANSYYSPSGTPATSAQGSSSDIRSEFALIETGLDKLPAITANYVVKVNSGGTALESVQFLAVAQGGTGANTLTDGGILLGSGVGAITAMAVLADGAMIVGDGNTDPVAESGATLRTSIGVGTGDNVTFTNVTGTGIGTFNSLVLTTDLAVTHGGTGSSTASGARTNLGLGSLATLSSINGGNWSGTDLALVDGGTGSSTASGARTNLGLGSLATISSINNGNWSGTDLAVVNGGTGSSTSSGAATNLGLGTSNTVTFSTVHAAGTTDSTSTTTGSLHTHGGLGVVKNFHVNGDLVHTHTTDSVTRLGVSAGGSLGSLSFGTAFGFEALKVCTVTENTAVGYQAILLNTEQEGNTAVGWKSLTALVGVGAGENTAIGTQSGVSLTNGTRNCFMGERAGVVFINGSNNTMLGRRTNGSSSTGSDQISIGSGAVCTLNQQVTIGSETNRVRCDWGSNSDWTQTSDIRRKTNIHNAVLGLDFINDLRVVTYSHKPANELPPEWNIPVDAEIDTTQTMHSLIAQEALAAILKAGVDPDTFSGWGADEQGQRISKTAYVMPLIKAVQQLTARLEALEAAHA